MRRRLFWKILFAFWLTFLAITQGVWLMFALSSDGPSRPARSDPDPVASVLLLSAAEIVRQTGPAGFERYAMGLPEHQRSRLELRPVPPPSPQTADEEGARSFSRAVTGPDGREYEVRFRQPAGRRLPLLNTPPDLLALGLLGGLLFSAALAWYLTEPINRLRLGFEHLARGDLDTRIGSRISRRRDEIADLARDFDVMAGRLEQLVKARDRLLHDVSHELRSPLARLQLAIALARQAPSRTAFSLDRIEREASRLDILVGELLALARAEQGDLRGEAYFDVVEVVRTAVEDARFSAAPRRGSMGFLEGQLGQLFDLAEEGREQADKGIAAAMAQAEPPMPSAPGRTSYAGKGAVWRGEYAFSLGLAHRLDTDQPFALSASIAHAPGASTGATVGFAGEF